MKHKIYLTLTLVVLSLGLCVCSTSAQKREAIFKGTDWKKMVEAARSGDVKIDKKILARVEAAYAEPKAEANISISNNLPGTWFITVPGPTPAENFYAYQTFGNDGTFVETSSLLVTLTEGPAHGVWESRRQGAVLTFELFAFDPENQVQVGRVRVRNAIRMTGADSLTSDSVADFIELDGTVIPNIGTGVFTGARVQLRGLN